MRFYSEIRIEPQKHLDEICENPHLVFSKDFIYYLAVVHGVDWRPNRARPAYNSYQPHPLSPCTKNVKEAIEQILATSKLDYELLYGEFVPDQAENKLEMFVNRSRRILVKLTENPLEAFFTLLHLGRWTISFYKHGTKDAAHLVPHLMADALSKTIDNSSMWFYRFDVISHNLSELLRNGHVEGFIEEYSLYFQEIDDANEDDEDDDEELDEDDEFDECSTCICGLCEDLFEYCEEYDEDDLDEEDYNEDNDLDEEEYENSGNEDGEILEDVQEEDEEENQDDD